MFDAYDGTQPLYRFHVENVDGSPLDRSLLPDVYSAKELAGSYKVRLAMDIIDASLIRIYCCLAEYECRPERCGGIKHLGPQNGQNLVHRMRVYTPKEDATVRSTTADGVAAADALARFFL